MLSKGSREMVCGVEAIWLRDFLASLCGCYEFDLEEYLKTLGFSKAKAVLFIDNLMLENLVEVSCELPDRSKSWVLTKKGRNFAQRVFGNGIKKETADRLLREFLERVHFVNNESPFAGYVEKASVFGGYLRGKEIMGDVDVAVKVVSLTFLLGRLTKDDEVRNQLNSWRGNQSGIYLGCMQCMADTVEVDKYLRTRGKLNIIPFSELERLEKEDGAESREVFHDERGPEFHARRLLQHIEEQELRQIGQDMKPLSLEFLLRLRAGDKENAA